jgi:hypothetical protein
MGTGYTRNDTSNNIADGNVINASDLDGEFDALQSAFDASSGHSHDGTTGEGPQIAAAGIANNAVALGTKTTGNYVATGAVSGVGLSGSASAEGATFTVTSNATNANTANTIVSRDASGNFSAGTVTAALTGDVTGNADTATSLETARTIGGVSFNGTANINLPGVNTSGNQDTSGNATTATALATGRTIGMTGDVVWTSASFDGSGNVTGTATIQANSVALGTDTTGNYVGTITGGTGIDSTGATSGEGITHTLSLDLNELTTSTSDGDGDFFAVVDSSGNQKKLTKGNVNISGFNNNSGFITSADGGNAATLDSLDSTQFLRSDAADTKTSGDLSFGDNVKATFGAGNDLELVHNGSLSYIRDNGAGDLYIGGDSNVLITNSSLTENKATFTTNGAVSLYYDNAVKLATTSTGVTVTGTAIATTDTDTTNTGSVTLDFGANQNFVLTLTGNVTLANPSTEQVGQSGFITFIQDGTGGRTVSLGTDYETAGAAGLTLSSAASTTDIVPYVVAASGRILLGAPQLAFA